MKNFDRFLPRRSRGDAAGPGPKALLPLLLLGLLCLFFCAACGEPAPPPTPPPTEDPYAGMVQVPSGFGTLMWVRAYPELPVNDLRPEDFSPAANYIGDRYLVLRGIDVSEHQGEIDWSAVRASEIEFAILRAGYRGYGEAGTLNADTCFAENVNSAMLLGIPIGVYFFSQATGPEEAVEEAEYLLELLRPYPPQYFSLPVYYDWEAIGIDEARTDGMDSETITACAAAFCARIAEAGYTPGIYAYRNLGYFSYDLRLLKDYSLWIASVGAYPDFYYAHAMWQYSYQGKVPGIGTDVDLDLLFLPRETEAEAADAS